jgi:pSer/pThr/pTyr-binding forkhead associated (FHA) protein
VPPFVLTVLKISLLAMLYFFIYRAIRAIAVDLYGRRERRGRAGARTRPIRRVKATPTRIVVLDEEGGKLGTHRLTDTLHIGRDSACDISLSDTYASQQHARISNRNGSWVIEDLGSTNGTYLNQRKVTVPAELAPGDSIRIGKTVLEVRK